MRRLLLEVRHMVCKGRGYRPALTFTSCPLSTSSLQTFHMMKTCEGAPHNGRARILLADVPAAQVRTMRQTRARMASFAISTSSSHTH